MAARKLHAEIDRTLKKVQEGSEAFDSIYEKMSSTQNATQKEKLEADLKTQIKKLQRMRDQIKTWQASSEIKDKTQLVEHRKLIETQMEKFKACEKEMKTKAFSKEGLIAAMRLDPKAQEKLETSNAVSEWVEELGRQIEQAEAEIETLQVGRRKKGNAAPERLELLEHQNERRRWHMTRLEIILRLLDNGSLPPEKIKDLQDDIKYFVESNTDEDFEEDESLYEDLHLDEVEDTFGIGGEERDSENESGSDNEDAPTRSKDTGKRSSHDDDQSVSSSRKDEPSSPVLKRQPALGLRRPTIDKQEPVKPPPTANFAQQPMASIVKHGLPQPAPRPPPLPPVRYAAAAAAAVAPQQSTSQTNASATAPAPSTPVTSLPSQLPEAPAAVPSLDQGVPASPSLTHPSVSGTSPMLSSGSVSQPIATSQGSRATPPPSSLLESTGNSPSSSHALSEVAPAATSSPQRMPSGSASLASPLTSSQAPFLQPSANGSAPPPGLTQVQQPPIQQPSPLPQQVQQFPQHSNQSNGSSPLPTGSLQYPPGIKAPSQQQHPGLHTETHPQLAPSQAQQQRQPQHPAEHAARPASATSRSGPNSFPGMSDLVASFESAKHKAATRMADLPQVVKVLDSGYSSMPMPQDTEKPKYYAPRNPYSTPSYYPQTLLPVLSTPVLFAKLDVETLFYVFYYLPGTYFQHLAAQELKRQSWRFHVKYLTWFQRHSEPQAITDEYEQGVYVYFDWEGSWCQRKKSDFRFEYRYLSED